MTIEALWFKLASLLLSLEDIIGGLGNCLFYGDAMFQ